eukprot:11159462-Lingulodinium_polyedra.AAC.1
MTLRDATRRIPDCRTSTTCPTGIGATTLGLLLGGHQGNQDQPLGAGGSINSNTVRSLSAA